MEGLKKEKLFYLDCIYDNRKSFYKKAYVKKIKNIKGVCFFGLYSYDTLVCMIPCDNNNQYILTPYSFYSQTTARHVKEFLKQFLKYTEVKQKLIDNNYSKKIILSYAKYINI